MIFPETRYLPWITSGAGFFRSCSRCSLDPEPRAEVILSYPEPLSRTQLWPSAGRSATAETDIVFDDNTRSECSLIGCRVADAVRAHELSADAIGLGCGV